MKLSLSLRSVLTILCLVVAGGRLAHAQSNAATFGQVIPLGGTPSDIVLDELRGRLYLVNDRSNCIDVYRIADKQTDVCKVKFGNSLSPSTPLAAAMSMDGAFLYVTISATSSLAVINLGNLQITQMVRLTAKPEGVEVGLDGRVLISTLGSSGNQAVNTLLIFDPTQDATQAVTAVQTPPPPTT